MLAHSPGGPVPIVRFLLSLAVLLAASPAAARGWDPEVEGGEVVVVQDRPVELRHEFTFGAGILPLDAFYSAWAVTGSYTYHPSETLAWEVASAFLATEIDSGLQDELLERFTVQPTRFEKISSGVFTHLVIKPFYGKRTLFNGPVWPAETSFVIGAGAVKYTPSLRAAADIGIVFRIHLAEWFSVRFSVRDLVPVDVRGGVDNVLLLDLGAAFNFGGG